VQTSLLRGLASTVCPDRGSGIHMSPAGRLCW